MSSHTVTIRDGIEVIRHPVIDDAMATLRSAATPTSAFRGALRIIARGLVFEGTRLLPTRTESIETPLERTDARVLQRPIVAIPILRAGLGLLDEFIELIPAAAAGFIGLKRDDATLLPREYYRNLPPLKGSSLFILDPMVATGGSVIAALQALKNEEIRSRTLLSVIAAPEGLNAIRHAIPEIRIVVAALDRGLNDQGFILPGLGDAGDRLWETP